MWGSYLKQAFWRFVFPGDRASPALVAAALLVNGAVILAASAAYDDAVKGECLDGTKSWLATGVINDAVHIVFAIYFIFAVRRRALRCTIVPPEMTVPKFVLHDYGLWLYCAFCVWVVVWMAMTYHNYPLTSSRRIRAANDALPDSDDSVPYTCDVCCKFCTVISSVNVAYIPLVAILIVCTVITEGLRQPRWWHTILLQDLRQRELRALYDEERPRSPTRVNLNADTDREMIAAGVAAPPRPGADHLRFRRAGKRYESVQADDFDERRPRHGDAKGPQQQQQQLPHQAPKSKAWAPPAAVEASKSAKGVLSVSEVPPAAPVVGRNIAPGAKRKPLESQRREDRRVHFSGQSDNHLPDDAGYWRPPRATQATRPVLPRTSSRKAKAAQQSTSIDANEGFVAVAPSAQEGPFDRPPVVVRSGLSDIVSQVPQTPSQRVALTVPTPATQAAALHASSAPPVSSAYVSKELDAIQALINAPPQYGNGADALDHDALDFEIDSEEEFELLDDNAMEFEIDDD